jgi:hypothetical protein
MAADAQRCPHGGATWCQTARWRRYARAEYLPALAAPAQRNTCRQEFCTKDASDNRSFNCDIRKSKCRRSGDQAARGRCDHERGVRRKTRRRVCCGFGHGRWSSSRVGHGCILADSVEPANGTYRPGPPRWRWQRAISSGLHEVAPIPIQTGSLLYGRWHVSCARPDGPVLAFSQENHLAGVDIQQQN